MKSTIHPVTPHTSENPEPPQARITFAIFHLLSALHDCEPLIKKQLIRHDVAHICQSAATSLSHAADRLRTTPAKAKILRQIQNEIENTQLN